MTAFADTALRTFDSHLAPLFKGLSFSTFAPIILIALLAVLAFKFFFGNYADPHYSSYARSLGLTAANLWDHRNELGLSPSIRGRTLESLEPLTEVLDALAHSVKKYEVGPPPNVYRKPSSKIRFE